MKVMSMDQLWWSMPVIPPLSRPRQDDQESESAWECVEKPYFTTATGTNNNKKQTRRKPKHGVPV